MSGSDFLVIFKADAEMTLREMQDFFRQKHDEVQELLNPEILRQCSPRTVKLESENGDLIEKEVVIIVYKVKGQIRIDAVERADDLIDLKHPMNFGEIDSFFDAIRHWTLLCQINEVSQEVFDLINEAISVEGSPEVRDQLVRRVGQTSFDLAMYVDTLTMNQYLTLLEEGVALGAQLSLEVHWGRIKWQDRFEEYRQYGVLSPEEWQERVEFTTSDEVIGLMSEVAAFVAGDDGVFDHAFEALNLACGLGFGYVFDCGFAQREDVSLYTKLLIGLWETVNNSDFVSEIFSVLDSKDQGLALAGVMVEYFGTGSIGEVSEFLKQALLLWENHESLLVED